MAEHQNSLRCGRRFWTGSKTYRLSQPAAKGHEALCLQHLLTIISADGNYRLAFGIFSGKKFMQRTYLLIFAFLAVCVWSGLEVRAQPRLYGCTRSGFETYPEAEKRPVIRYLDAARKVADKSVRVFFEGHIDQLYSAMSLSFKESHTEKDFLEKFAAYEGQIGKVLDYQYRDQAFTYDNPEHIDLHNGWVTTRYLARASGWDGGVIIEVNTAQPDSTPLLTGIEILRFDAATSVDTLYPKGTGEPCPWIKGPLTITPIN